MGDRKDFSQTDLLKYLGQFTVNFVPMILKMMVSFAPKDVKPNTIIKGL